MEERIRWARELPRGRRRCRTPWTRGADSQHLTRRDLRRQSRQKREQVDLLWILRAHRRKARHPLRELRPKQRRAPVDRRTTFVSRNRVRPAETTNARKEPG